MPIKIKELPELERPYEKLEWFGEERLSDAELLAIIIKTGTKNENSVQVAQKILNLNDTEIEGINFLRNITIEELKKVNGIGKVKAIQLKAVGELASRMTKPTNTKKIIIREPLDLAKIMIEELRFQTKEIAKIVILNNKNEIIKIKDIAIGGVNFTSIEAKDILELPVKMAAPKMILVHNHPTGDASPSEQDIIFTNRLYDAADLMGIQLMDHLVIGNKAFTSIFSTIAQMAEDEEIKNKKGR